MTLDEAFDYIVSLMPPMSKAQLDDITEQYEFFKGNPVAAWDMIKPRLLQFSPPVSLTQRRKAEELYNQ